MEETLYKVLSADGHTCHGGSGKWNLPTLQADGSYKPGRWMPKCENIEPCVRGYHLCRRGDLIHWLHESIYVVEYRGERIDQSDKVVVASARLLRPLTTWNETTARLFAADCAEAALPFWERYYPNDDRPRKAIACARAFARGECSAEELAAAWDAAWDAAGDAAARAAGAAGDAAWAAARAAGDAAGAAGAAARDAAWAAGAAAGAAARAAQTEMLFQYLEGRKS
jgi:hypothetical protein